MKYESEVKDYFKNKADRYDLVNNQPYWKLSDKLLWNTFGENLLSTLPNKFRFLDAGGGTGRWSMKILEAYNEARGTLFDLSEDMLGVANKKLVNSLEKRLNLVKGDLHNMDSIENESYDIAFNFHNVLGFVKNPKEVINQINALPSSLRTSMQRDIMSKRPSEFESITGGVMRLAESYGIPIPAHKHIYNLISKKIFNL